MQAVLRGRQRAGGVRGERARGVVGLVEVEHDVGGARHLRVEKSAGRVGLLTRGEIAKDEEQLAVLLSGMEALLMAIPGKDGISRTLVFLLLSEDVRDHDLFDSRDPAGVNACRLLYRIPAQPGKLAPETAVAVAQTDAVTIAALDEEHGEILNLHHVGGLLAVGFKRARWFAGERAGHHAGMHLERSGARRTPRQIGRA